MNSKPINIAVTVAAIISLLLIFVSLNGADAAVARAVFHNPDYPGKCVIDHNNVMSPGQSGKAPDHPCAGITCMENSHVLFQTCPATPPPKGCKLRDFVNTERAFPACCERSYDCTVHV